MIRKLLVPETLVRETSTLLRGYARKRVEAGCFWYGIRRDELSIAVRVGISRQRNRPGNFSISGDDLAALTNAACAPGLVAVAQLHLHPGSDVEHSPWDDAQIVSRNILSLVVPHYGAAPLNIRTLGVHCFEDGRWQMLSALKVQEVVRVIPTVVDTR